MEKQKFSLGSKVLFLRRKSRISETEIGIGEIRNCQIDGNSFSYGIQAEFRLKLVETSLLDKYFIEVKEEDIYSSIHLLSEDAIKIINENFTRQIKKCFESISLVQQKEAKQC